MSCRLYGAKILLETNLANCQLDLKEKFQWNLNENTILIQANEFENVVCNIKPFCLNVLIPFAIVSYDNGKKLD